MNLTWFTWPAHPPVSIRIHTFAHTVLRQYIFTSYCSPGLGLESESGNLLLTLTSPLSAPNHFLLSLQIYNSVGVFKSGFSE